jgi:hypothetical protein
MPIRKQSIETNRRTRKKAANNRIIFSIVALLFLVILITAYFFFWGKSDDKTNYSLKKAEASNSINEQAPPFIVDNSQEAIARARLQMETVDSKDVLRVIVEKSTAENNSEIVYRYEWSINGQPAGSGSDSIGGFKRGDKVVVKITPVVGEKTGNPRVLTMYVQNTTPTVSESKEPKYDGKAFTAQINASDPDGDTLSYELLSGPEGMTIDKKSGMVNWPLKESDSGDYPVKVKITDGHGGEIMYQLTATIPKETPPTAMIPKKTP